VTVDYRTHWFAEAICRHTQVVTAEALPHGHVRITRDGLSEVTVAPIAPQHVDEATVGAVLDVDVPTVILLIPKASHYSWAAREFAEDHGSTIHTYKEFFGALSFSDPRPYVNKDVAFARDRLQQHTKVRDIHMICEASMRVERHSGLSDLVVAVEYEYEFSEEAVVHALSRHPAANVILNGNPNGRPTNAALAHAQHAGVSLVKIGELMSNLSRGDLTP
jgi:hypothetical protein